MKPAPFTGAGFLLFMEKTDIILRDDGRFLLVRRSPDDAFLPGRWEVPGGASHYGEPPEEAARREVMEECGLAVAVHQPLSVGQYFIGATQRVMILFACSLRDDDPSIVQLSHEHDDFAWVSADEFPRYPTDEFTAKLLSRCVAEIGAPGATGQVGSG